APSIWTAYRTVRPTGIATGTWLLTLGELTCWLAFGLHKSDPRLIILGGGGIICCALILARVRRTSAGSSVRLSPAGQGRRPRGCRPWPVPAPGARACARSRP